MLRNAPFAALAALAFAATTAAQAIPVPLNYNFNGIVHLGESGLPDDPNGYRSISDRGLDWQPGVPADPLLTPYMLVTTPGVLDIVHLGNRNTVSGGQWAFDAVPDADNIGIQPNWLANPDQTGPQITTLATPLPVGPTSKAAFLYQISNGGGSFDVTFRFASSNSYTATMSGSDWFGGPFIGTQDVDTANPGNNLSITETKVDLSGSAGETILAIEFSNRSNLNAGYAILACNIEYPPEPRRVNQIPLAYNFNGIVHAGESGLPDDPNGYRSISDRGLDWQAGVPNDPLLQPYSVVSAPGVLDIVHLGDRNTVDGGLRVFDLVPDNDDIGIQPTWLPNSNQAGPQLTMLQDPILLDAASSASVLFQISNGGGSFDVEFTFQTGAPVVATVSGGDWFGGGFLGTGNTDNAFASANLSLVERTIDLSAEAGRTLMAISFQNRSNTNAGYAIVAMNVVGCLSCLNGMQGVVTNLGGGAGPTITTSTNGNLGCDLDWIAAGLTPSAVGVFALGLGVSSTPLASIVPTCPGTIRTGLSPAILLTIPGANGRATATIPAPVGQNLCGVQITGQYLQLTTGTCYVRISDALTITIGN
ncbi:MAG: hypothetical protein KDE27_01765 [Planctomycetes bacterium]|nr:hypothetical protein [Planctomycetota bacterium]